MDTRSDQLESRRSVNPVTGESIEIGSLDAVSIPPALNHGEESGANDEGLYRFVAYTSPYLFWLIVVGLSLGIMLV